MNFVILLFSIVINILITETSFSKNIYVNIDDVTPSYLSIYDAYTQAQNDDIIFVGEGRYDEDLEIKKSISLIGAGPQYSFITRTINIKMKDVVVMGFTISSSNGNGINVALSATNSGVCTIKNCIIISCLRSGITTGNGGGESTVIQNNVIIYNNSYGIDTGFFGTPTICNNIIVYNKQLAIKTYENGQFKGTSFNNVYKNYLENEALDNYELSVGDISMDPLFINPDSGNFALQDSSPCKNAGVLGPLYIDPDGTRSDMGAYGGPDSESFWPYNDSIECFTQEDIEKAIAEKDEIINQKNQIIASMFTSEEKEEAVSSAEDEKDEIIKLKDQIIDSMFTLEEKEKDIEKALSEKDIQCQSIIQNEILIERNKWDINKDNKKNLFEAIDSLKTCIEFSTDRD